MSEEGQLDADPESESSSSSTAEEVRREGDVEMEEREAEEVVASMEEEAGSDQLAPEKCGKEKVPFINWEEIEIPEALQEEYQIPAHEIDMFIEEEVEASIPEEDVMMVHYGYGSDPASLIQPVSQSRMNWESVPLTVEAARGIAVPSPSSDQVR